eukprot:GHVN01061968.1.p1 GENE.GHVN01061968.1~~GHVN01061968.1.p1  ORF type:complete len:279 (-),score=8.73 GHVN01061968.1:106-942(-)
MLPWTLGCTEVRFRHYTETIDAIQKKLSAETGLPLTKNDIIVANTWQCIVRAEEAEKVAKSEALKAKGEELPASPVPLSPISHLIVPVNMRENKHTGAAPITSPNRIPENYFGNAVLGCMTLVPKVELIKMPLAVAASSVHNEIRAFATTGRLRACFEWEAQRAPAERGKPCMPSGDWENIGITNWTKYGMYAVNFSVGGLGCPGYSTHLILPGPFPRLCHMIPSPPSAVEREGALLDLGICLSEGSMQRLLADEEFLAVKTGVAQRTVVQVPEKKEE